MKTRSYKCLISLLITSVCLTLISCQQKSRSISEVDIANYKMNDTDRALVLEWSNRVFAIRDNLISQYGYYNYINDPRSHMLPAIGATKSMEWSGASWELQAAVLELNKIKEGDDFSVAMPYMRYMNQFEIKYKK